MRKLLHKFGQRNAITDMVFMYIMFIAFVPIAFIVCIEKVGLYMAIYFWVMSVTMLVVDIEWGYGTMALTDTTTRPK